MVRFYRCADTLPSPLLAMMMAWVLVRTLPFLGVYGANALRDSVVIMYGGFAFIVTALLLEDNRRLNIIVLVSGRFWHWNSNDLPRPT